MKKLGKVLKTAKIRNGRARSTPGVLETIKGDAPLNHRSMPKPNQEQAVDVQPGTATKRGPGRPPLEESAKIQEERRAAQEAVSEKQSTRPTK
jgi:hypothetical protein